MLYQKISFRFHISSGHCLDTVRNPLLLVRVELIVLERLTGNKRDFVDERILS